VVKKLQVFDHRAGLWRLKSILVFLSPTYIGDKNQAIWCEEEVDVSAGTKIRKAPFENS
jgi:hypothetical protein